MLLGIRDNFGQAVVDHPSASADGADAQGFIETGGTEADFLVLVVFTDGASHGVLLFSLLPKYRKFDLLCKKTIPPGKRDASEKTEKVLLKQHVMNIFRFAWHTGFIKMIRMGRIMSAANCN
jgi:hypothetical protein